jgi:phosphopantetheine--protein transferase-like protein
LKNHSRSLDRRPAELGVDQGAFSALSSWGLEQLTVQRRIDLPCADREPCFASRNFADAEIACCRAQLSFRASFAVRWEGREAAFKPLGISSKGAGAAMREIEVLPNGAGVPEVTLHGDAKARSSGEGSFYDLSIFEPF